MTFKSSLALVLLLGVAVPTLGRSPVYKKQEQPSVLSAFLDLLPEVENLAERNQIEVNVPKIKPSQAHTITEIFEMFVPFVREVFQARAEQTGEQLSQETYENLDILDRIFPKLINLVLAIGSRSTGRPGSEPDLPDYSYLAKGNQYGSSEESGEYIELPNIDRDVLRKVFNRTSAIFSQITDATRSDSDETSYRRPTPSRSSYYIDNTTTRRPYSPRRRPYATSAPRRSYGTTTTTPRPTYGTTARPSYAARGSSEEGEVPGASVSFFNLPSARSYQRVTRGSPYEGEPITRQLKPNNYYYA